jgi:hypothetical protein
MTSTSGVQPPLHRRYDPQVELELVRKRYSETKARFAVQVEKLQACDEFVEKCKVYYSQGYKDWVILGAIANTMLNLRIAELGADVMEDGIGKRAYDDIRGRVYPVGQFLGSEMGQHIEGHCAYVLKSYGFELRRSSIPIKDVEWFFRYRMKHFECDVPHEPMFARPIGAWPVI